MHFPEKLRPWFGDEWIAPQDSTPARLVRSVDSLEVAVQEWDFTTRGVRVLRTVAVLRRKKLALITESVDRVEGSWTIDVPLPGMSAVERTDDEPGGLFFEHPGSLDRVQLVPLTLNERRGGSPDRIEVRSEQLSWTREQQGGPAWMPLMIAWGAPRGSAPAARFDLTVTHRGKECSPAEAIAARVAWSRADQYVVYRSLTGPVQRSFLGHQTTARSIIGQFLPTGGVRVLDSQKA